jgi:xanthine dehydrogenase YagS FAD-binding subunit
MIAPFEWVDARTLDQALGALGAAGALAKAGGVDVMDRLKEGLDAPSRLVNLRGVAGLDGILEGPKGLHVGALVTLAELDVHPAVRQRYTALAEAAGHAATPQVRNVATVGGNLLQRPRCWYFRSAEFDCRKKGGDRCPAQDGENEYHAIFGNRLCAMVHPSSAAVALVALDAVVEVAGPRGRRELPIEKLFVTPETDLTREHTLATGELLTGIRLPTASGARSAYMKLGEKESFDWPIAETAVYLEQADGRVTKARIVLGAAAPVPLRATAAEAALTGKPLTPETARAAAAAAVAGATPLSGNAYKVRVLETVVRRTLLTASGLMDRA